MTALAWFLPSACSQAAEADRFLPGDTEIIVHVNLRQALDSDLVKKYALEQIKTQLKQSAELQAVLTAAGVDPIKDIASLTLAAPGKLSADNGLVIVRGNFDADKFHKAAADFADKNPESLKIHKSDHGPLYEGKDKNKGKPVFATLLSQGTLVFSPSRKLVLDAVARNGDKKPAPLNKKLQTLVGAMDGKQGIWIAALPSKELKAELAKNPQGKNIANKLQTLSGGITIAQDAKAEIRIQTSDAKAALEIRRLLEVGKALLIFRVADNEVYGPLLADIVSGIKIRTDKGAVNIEAVVTAAQIEQGLKSKPKP